MRYTQLLNHFQNNFLCSGLDNQKWYIDLYVW